MRVGSGIVVIAGEKVLALRPARGERRHSESWVAQVGGFPCRDPQTLTTKRPGGYQGLPRAPIEHQGVDVSGREVSAGHAAVASNGPSIRESRSVIWGIPPCCIAQSREARKARLIPPPMARGAAFSGARCWLTRRLADAQRLRPMPGVDSSCSCASAETRAPVQGKSSDQEIHPTWLGALCSTSLVDCHSGIPKKPDWRFRALRLEPASRATSPVSLTELSVARVPLPADSRRSDNFLESGPGSPRRCDRMPRTCHGPLIPTMGLFRWMDPVEP